jgi:His/Glu/Gln/Arg/opine family amino acid ABC transporter permease subunit
VVVDPDLLRLLLRGATVTLQVTGWAVALGTVLAIVGGVSSLSSRRWVRWLTATYVELFRGVAALILLYIAAFAIPQALGIRPAGLAFNAAVLALGTNMGAYGTEIARGAIKSIPQGQTEAGIAVNLAIKNLGKWMQPKKVKNPITLAGTFSFIQYEPKGTSLIISPWNFPFQLTVTPLVSALAAGCTAVLKPSELTAHTSALLRRMVSEVFSKEEVALFEGNADVAKMLLRKPFNHIFFTGSQEVGKHVMKAASENLSSITLELGGKSPLIVDKDINIKDAAQKIVWGKFVNAGQTCVAPDYALVHSSIMDPFLAEVKEQIRKMYSPKGKAIEKSKDFARIIDQRHLKRLNRLLSDARLKGASLFSGGHVNEEENYFEPTILTQVTEDMSIMQEEIFGPILPVMPYTDIEDITHLINQKLHPNTNIYTYSTPGSNPNENNNTEQLNAYTNTHAKTSI